MARQRQKSVLMCLGAYNPLLHRGIARYAAEHRWHLQADMAVMPVIPWGWQGDGIVAYSNERKELQRFLRGEISKNTPLVDTSLIHPETPRLRVVGDNRGVGQLAAEDFLARGWRHFAWFTRQHHYIARLRQEGFTEVLTRQGHRCLSLTQPLHFNVTTVNWPMMRRNLIRALKSLQTPVAVFAFNDYDAAFLMDCCFAAGLRVPDDVGILGVDDNDLVVNNTQVPLSSVRFDHERIGYEAAAALDQLMQGRKKPPPLTVIPPRGIAVRASTDIFAVHHPAVRSALRFIQDNLGRSLGVTEIARASGLSCRTLETAFLKETTRSIHKEIMRMRIQTAKELLHNTTLPIEDIAAKTGFCHAPHFHRVFHQAEGKTPRTYRLNL